MLLNKNNNNKGRCPEKSVPEEKSSTSDGFEEKNEFKAIFSVLLNSITVCREDILLRLNHVIEIKRFLDLSPQGGKIMERI